MFFFVGGVSAFVRSTCLRDEIMVFWMRGAGKCETKQSLRTILPSSPPPFFFCWVSAVLDESRW